jgi:hypothetical protein
VRVKTDRVDFVLCDKDELEKVSGRWKTAGHTLIQARTLAGRKVGEKTTIYILSHLGRTRFESVAAHELTHVYLHQQVKRELSSPIVEGLCNYMGSLFLERSPTDLARYYLATMDEDPDPDYGEGYRRVRAYVQAHSLDELLRKLKRGGSADGL